jgi:hypothetical protein
MVLILVPRVLAMASSSIAAWIINLPPYAEYSLMWAAMLLIAVAGCITAYRDWQTPRTLNGQSAIFRSETLFFWVIITAAWLILESRLAGWMDDPLGSGARGYGYVSGARVLGLISGFTLASIPMSVSRFYSARRSLVDPFRVGRRLLWGRVLWSFCAPVLVGAAMALTVDLFAVHVIPLLSGDGSLSNYPNPSFNVLGLPIILSLLMLGSAVLSGLLSIVESEEEREWWARAGGVLSIVLLAWVCAEVVGWYSELIAITLGNSFLLWGGGTAIFGEVLLPRAPALRPLRVSRKSTNPNSPAPDASWRVIRSLRRCSPLPRSSASFFSWARSIKSRSLSLGRVHTTANLC